MCNPRQFSIPSLILLGLSSLNLSISFAQELPREITTRLWERPGPVQDAPGAPRLLLVYPAEDAGPREGQRARYGGRVEPPDAEVTLNGTPLQVGHGGVFIGVKELPAPGERATWTFTARAGGQSTTIERTLETAPPPPPPLPARPLAFWRAPVAPTGDFWLREGSTLPVTLYASPGATAEVRLGPAHPWQPLQAQADARRGGRYTATLTMPALEPAAPQALAPVEFRLRAGDEEKTLTSQLKLGILRRDQRVTGELLINRVTFLKNPTGWERWGNWADGTLFPVHEQLNDRLSTPLGAAEPGGLNYVDNEDFSRVKLNLNATTEPLVALGRPRCSPGYGGLRVTWPGVAGPVAFRLNPLPGPETSEFTIELLGAGRAEPYVWEPNPDLWQVPPWLKVEVATPPGRAPELRVQSSGDSIWGWDVLTSGTGTAAEFAIELNRRPFALEGTPERPLTGIRIMLDPGHGGRDTGAIGPSGLCESDLNLVQAGYVERVLRKLGAEVKLTRRDDTFVELDDRVAQALAWRPDLFVSLHHNSVGGEADPWAKSGPELYAHYDLARPVAEEVGAPLVRAWGVRGVLPARPHVARVIRNLTACPAVLIETGYVTHPADEIRLRQTGTVRRTGEALAEGIASLWPRPRR